MREKNTKQYFDSRRESSAKRGYGYKWQKARKQFIDQHPFCAFHKDKGKLVYGSVVDHINPHKNNSQLFWDRSNWQTLCKPCHDSKKQRYEKSGTIAGCNDSGIPIDPNHHWNRG